MTHSNNFDFLRFLLSFLVVIGHTIILSEQPEFQNSFFVAMPNYSVLGFFIISGFLIYSSYERSKNLKKYFFNRAKRILPAYFFAVLFFAFFLFLFSAVTFKEYFSFSWLKHVGVNLIFLNFIKPCIDYVFTNNMTCAVNGSLWTIKVEVMFYLFIPILFYFIKKLNTTKKTVAIIGLYVFSMVYFSVLTSIDKGLLAKQLPGFLNYFATGMLLYVNKEFFSKYIYYLLPAAVIILVLEKAVILQSIFTPLAIGIIIFWFAFSKIPLKNFGKYGDFSYGMYLVHFPIIQIFTQQGIYEKYSYLGFALSTAVVFLFSVIIWNVIEKNALKRKFNQKSAV